MLHHQIAGEMNQGNPKICVYYDGACPKCVKDRRNYERLAGESGNDIQWIDITGKEDLLVSIGIDPKKALMELHVQDENRQILSEIDAYVLLMSKVPVLKPLAKIIGLRLVRPVISKVYHWQVNRRLRRSGRL
jgi:predicted DCC family thiol-disulfide oxidoreductase YuxK